MHSHYLSPCTFGFSTSCVYPAPLGFIQQPGSPYGYSITVIVLQLLRMPRRRATTSLLRYLRIEIDTVKKYRHRSLVPQFVIVITSRSYFDHVQIPKPTRSRLTARYNIRNVQRLANLVGDCDARRVFWDDLSQPPTSPPYGCGVVSYFTSPV